MEAFVTNRIASVKEIAALFFPGYSVEYANRRFRLAVLRDTRVRKEFEKSGFFERQNLTPKELRTLAKLWGDPTKNE